MTVVDISGIGMMTSLGNAVHGAAAQRAGIGRPSQSLVAEVADEESGSQPIVVHRAFPYSDGFFQLGMWVRLASNVLAELVGSAELAKDDPTIWRHTLLVGAVPILEEDRFGWPAEIVDDVLRQQFLEVAARLAGLPLDATQTACFPRGHVGVAHAIRFGRDEITAGRADRVIVIGADSYLDPRSLGWLAGDGRLKSGDQPVGLAPGEAGGGFLLESAPAREARGRACDARFISLAIGDSPPHHAGAGELETETGGDSAPARDEEDIAERLAAVIRETLRADSERSERYGGDLLVDLNGELWKARVFGTAQTRLHDVVDWDAARIHFPVVEMGETGAATPAVGICLGVRSFARRYARSDRSLVCSIADDGEAAAILMAAPS